MTKKFLNSFTFLVVTILGIGKIKYAPGTFGSIVAIPPALLFFFSLVFVDKVFPSYFYYYNPVIFTLVILSALTLVLFLIGVYFCNIYLSDKTETDPKEIVFDEFVGQFFTTSVCALISSYYIKNLQIDNVLFSYFFMIFLPFILFRAFDIIKPWPINWIDKNVKGSFGVMLDDMLAALFAIIFYLAATLILIELW